MFHNYLIILFRTIRKNLIYTIISTLGLGIGIAGLIFTYLLFDYEAGFDSSYGQTGQVYRINTLKKNNTGVEKWGISPVPVGGEITGTVPGIQSFCRYGAGNYLVKYDDNVFSENIYFADTTFFRLFHFGVQSGNTVTFLSKNTAIISREFAKKYFGMGEATGKILNVLKNDTVSVSFQVGAVLDEIPANSSFQFDILLPYENAMDLTGLKSDDWTFAIPTVTYLCLDENTDPDRIAGSLEQFRKRNNQTLDNWQVEEFILSTFRAQKREVMDMHQGITWSGLPLSALYGSLFMNLVILLIACINFTNTSVAYARNRIREIGVRKTFGGIRRQIIFQFLSENGIQCLLAVIIGMDLAVRWVNWTNQLWPMKITVDYLHSPDLLLFLGLVLVLVTVLAGLYPSVYVANFQPSQILRGKLKFFGTNTLTRILLVWQFSFSVTAVFSGIALAKNARFQQELDWGFDKNNVIIVPLRDNNQFEVFKNAVLELPAVNEVAGANHNVGYSYTTADFDLNGNPEDCQLLLVGDNYVKTLGLKIVEGRDFMRNSENDMNETILVNERFIATFHIRSPFTQVIRLNDKAYYIAGIVRDFMPFGLYTPVQPAIIKLSPDHNFTLLCVKGEAGGVTALYERMQESWKRLFPEKPFEGYFQDDSAMNAAQTNDSLVKEFILMAIIALLISSSGLYSMMALSINKRIKEIGIRKVMGAGISGIIYLINREFIVIIAVATMLGTLMGYYFMDMFLEDIFTYHTTLGPSVFIITMAVILAGAVITSGRKVYRAAHTDPAKSLRYE